MNIGRWVMALCLSVPLLKLQALCSEFPPVSPDDLKLAAIAEQPGAPAVILYREEIDNDMLNEHAVYERIKILTEAGREKANVEIPYSRRYFTISGISGQTVHADGTVIPFTGKAFDKTVVKGAGLKINLKSFTLPDVQVGSVIDYRYSLRYDDHRLEPPTWEVQTDLFQRKAYFKFVPFQNHGSMYVQLAHDRIARGVAWDPIVGNGVAPELHQNPLSSSTNSTGQISMWVDLKESDVPALVEEPYMPPSSIMRWRVHFYYQESLNSTEYWKTQGKFWNKDVEGFVGKDRGVGAALSQILAPADTPEQKVRKIYAFVCGLENRDYVPERTKQEEKVLNLSENRGSDDVLERRSGTHDDLNRLFVSMVRAAGIPAWLIWVPDRSREVFFKDYLSTRQFDAEIAIVQLDGKDVFLDPGTKFCPFGVLDWRYSAVSGLRQGPKGVDFGETSLPEYKQAVTTRMAMLALNENGVASGEVVLVFKFLEAMFKRQEGGRTDDAGRKKLLEDTLRGMLPGNSEIQVLKEPDWTSTEAPLVVDYHVSIPLAVASGKRLMVQQHVFQSGEKSLFTASQRINQIYFHYPWQEADEVHIVTPAGMELESLAQDDTIRLEYALYQVRQKQEGPNRIFSRRDFVMIGISFPTKEYAQLKTFFEKVKNDDDQAALLKVGSNVASTN